LKNGAKPYNPIPIVRYKETSGKNIKILYIENIFKNNFKPSILNFKLESEKKPAEIRYEAYEKPTLPYIQNNPVIIPSFSEPRYGDSGLASPPIDDGFSTNWSGSPPITPGQLAWMSVLKESTFKEYEEFDGK
jgi:hypothetical protein